MNKTFLFLLLLSNTLLAQVPQEMDLAKYINPLVGTGVQFCVSAVVLLAVSLALDRGRSSDWNRTSILALGFLTVFGSVLTFSLYYWLLLRMHAYQLSTLNLLCPWSR